MRLTNLLLAATIILSISSVLTAQTKEEKAREKEEKARAHIKELSRGFVLHGGLVNSVDGEAECMCGTVSIPALGPKQEVTGGDTIKVGAGRVEILLSPGYYLRLGPHTEARLIDLTPGNLKIKLFSGSAIIEIVMDNYNSWFRDIVSSVFDMVTLITPRDEYAICRAGAYRLDIVSAEESKIRVLKGRVVVAGAALNDGRSASVVSGHVNVAAHEKAVADAFDTWSQERAASLVDSNKSLKRMDWYKEMQDGDAYLDAAEEGTNDATTARTISARHGLITFAEIGSILKNGNQEWEALHGGGTLSDGDRIRTEIDSRVEIHPYPDFYFFMNGNTEILFAEPEDGDISITLIKGSVVVVVAEGSLKARERNLLKVIAGTAKFDIRRKGYYHLNLSGPDTVEMLIYDGAVQSNGNEVGARKKLVGGGANLMASALDKDDQNSFDVWSERRVMRSLVSPARRKRWFAGAWYLNPSLDEYTFVPGARDCKSPYGGDYSVAYRINGPRASRRLEPGDPTIRSTSPPTLPRPF